MAAQAIFIASWPLDASAARRRPHSSLSPQLFVVLCCWADDAGDVSRGSPRLRNWNLGRGDRCPKRASAQCSQHPSLHSDFTRPLPLVSHTTFPSFPLRSIAPSFAALSLSTHLLLLRATSPPVSRETALLELPAAAHTTPLRPRSLSPPNTAFCTATSPFCQSLAEHPVLQHRFLGTSSSPAPIAAPALPFSSL